MKRFSLRYTLLSYKLDQLWFPLAVWLLFAAISVFLREAERVTDIARSFLGIALPLIGGMLAAFAVLDDPALELRFSMPTPAARLLFERLGLLFVIMAVAAFSYQVICPLLGGDLGLLGSWWDVQLAWLIPLVSLMALGCAGSLAAANPMGGAVIAGLLWLLELLAYDWLASNGGRYVLFFMGALRPAHLALPANRLVLALLAAALFLLAWVLLKRQERYV